VAEYVYHAPTAFWPGWAIDDSAPCVVDDASRVIANAQTYQYADNTPATCMYRCQQMGFTYAGLEYSNECHCGTGLKPGYQVAPTNQCDYVSTVARYIMSPTLIIICDHSLALETIKILAAEAGAFRRSSTPRRRRRANMTREWKLRVFQTVVLQG
jgi:hypothetical protein